MKFNKAFAMAAILMSAQAIHIRSRDDDEEDDSLAPQSSSTTDARVEEGVNSTRRTKDATNGLIPANNILDLDDTLGNYIGKQPEKKDMHLSGYNGADEEEIMDKVFNKMCVQALDSTNNRTSQKVLMQKAARRSAEILLEATHKLKEKDVPDYVNRNFQQAWDAFDQNKEGWIRYEETHTFMRHFFGRLNKFSVAPGSIVDVKTGGKEIKLSPAVEKTPVAQV